MTASPAPVPQFPSSLHLLAHGCATPGGAQGCVLAKLRGTNALPGLEPAWAARQASALRWMRTFLLRPSHSPLHSATLTPVLLPFPRPRLVLHTPPPPCHLLHPQVPRAPQFLPRARTPHQTFSPAATSLPEPRRLQGDQATQWLWGSGARAPSPRSSGQLHPLCACGDGALRRGSRDAGARPGPLDPLRGAEPGAGTKGSRGLRAAKDLSPLPAR